MIELLNEDNMQLMARYPDKYFDLAIVDPPYGEACNLKGGSSSKGTNGWSGKLAKANTWNIEPDKNYFNELFRVSKNQIIWGANHFIEKIPYNFSCFIIWDKGQRDFSLADGEMAWTSFKSSARFFNYSRAAALQDGKIHPTQKPVQLYRWILDRYAKKGDKILDTHLGSGSIAIACHDMGFDLVACEIDKDYYEAAVKRFNEQTKQLKLIA
jgi:site-specific DNA-methyltransferase (adenine-specific)